MKKLKVSLFLSFEYQFSAPGEKLASWQPNQYLNCPVKMIVTTSTDIKATTKTLAGSKGSL